GSPVAGLMDTRSPPNGFAIQSPWQAPEFTGSMSRLSRISRTARLAVCTLSFYREWQDPIHRQIEGLGARLKGKQRTRAPVIGGAKFHHVDFGGIGFGGIA